VNDIDFPLYAAMWYQKCGWIIPEVHFRIFDFLEDEDQWDNPNKSKVLLLWRGIGKSTITDIWVAYKITKNPKLRFLFLSADKETAKKSSQDILSILQNHPLSTHLIGPRVLGRTEVRKDQFYVLGNSDNRNPTVRALGILSNITGGRADYIIYDDVEVPKNSGNDSKRHDLRKKISESNHLLVPEIGRKLFIGTYHDTESIYDEQINNQANYLRVPIIQDVKGEFPYITGTPQWPERFNENWIANKQKESTSKAEFYSQYLLIPASINDSILDPARFLIYKEEIEFRTVNGRSFAKIGQRTLRSVSCWWDPSMAKARGDDSVVAIVYSDEEGHYYIHRTVAITGDTDEQCRAVRDIAVKNNVPVVCVETNGIGAMLPPMLIKHLKGTGIGVDGVFSQQSQTKNTRIIAAYETALYGSRLHIHQSVADSKFLRQIQDFNPATTKNRDDFIDAVASCILREPNIVGMNSYDISAGTISRWIPSGSFDLQLETYSI
jgi:predicted phage terminase large subunit-like protein